MDWSGPISISVSSRTIKNTAFAALAIALLGLVACEVEGDASATNTPRADSGGYLSVVDSASQPVIELEAEVATAVDDLVTTFGDSTISGSASGTVISLNRKATELADLAEQASFTLSQRTVSARCQPFHESQLEAMRQFGQEGFEFAIGTDIQGLSNPRLDLDAIERGQLARREALAALAVANERRGVCEG